MSWSVVDWEWWPGLWHDPLALVAGMHCDRAKCSSGLLWLGMLNNSNTARHAKYRHHRAGQTQQTLPPRRAQQQQKQHGQLLHRGQAADKNSPSDDAVGAIATSVMASLVSANVTGSPRYATNKKYSEDHHDDEQATMRKSAPPSPEPPAHQGAEAPLSQNGCKLCWRAGGNHNAAVPLQVRSVAGGNCCVVSHARRAIVWVGGPMSCTVQRSIIWRGALHHNFLPYYTRHHRHVC